MIDIRDMGRDFESRREQRQERRQLAQPTAPTAAEAQMPISTGQPAPFSPVSPSIPIGAPLPPGERGTAMPDWLVSGEAPPGGPMDFSIGYPGSTQIGGQPPGAGEFPYPEQWQTATDIYGELAGGMPAFTPEYMETAWAPYQRRGEEAGMQAREQAGLTGMRWGTPLAGQMESIWGGAAERFGGEMERMRMQDIAGQRGAMLGAAGGLGGLGGRYAQLPLTVAQSMMGLGGAQQQMQQAELDRQREEWLRQQPEYSPLLGYMGGGAQMPSGPAQYQPSFGGQMFDLSSMLGLAGQAGLFGGGGGGAPTKPLGGGIYPGEWGQLR